MACCAVLCCAVLCCAVLCCAVLCGHLASLPQLFETGRNGQAQVRVPSSPKTKQRCLLSVIVSSWLAEAHGKHVMKLSMEWLQCLHYRV